MKAQQQIKLPFKLIRGETATKNAIKDDLIGRRYFDGISDVIVTGVCHMNPKHVVVERKLDGKRWSVPAGLISLIVGTRKRRRVA
jgi:hypothetical protein